MSTGSFIDDLQDILDGSAAPAVRYSAPAKAEETFPCESCGGTGKYRGVRRHQVEDKCFACGGRGHFKTSAFDRMKARHASAQRKASAKELAQAAFHEQYPGLIDSLRAVMDWSSFAATMVASFEQWNSLTEKQAVASLNLLAKIAEKRAAKNEAKAANSGEVNVAAIEAMFATAKASGLKKLAFVAGGLRIKPAPEHGKNAGALYVTEAGEYQGKVQGGRFYAVHGANPATLATLNVIAANPSQAARDYGKKTGICCCCGRELTDPASIANGIGPICESNWGF